MSSRRSETTCAILGTYKEHDDRQLPVIRDVIKFILFVKNDLKLSPSNSDIFAIVYEEINKIWNKASILIVTKKRVIQLLKSYFEKYLNLKKIPQKQTK